MFKISPQIVYKCKQLAFTRHQNKPSTHNMYNDGDVSIRLDALPKPSTHAPWAAGMTFVLHLSQEGPRASYSDWGMVRGHCLLNRGSNSINSICIDSLPEHPGASEDGVVATVSHSILHVYTYICLQEYMD